MAILKLIYFLFKAVVSKKEDIVLSFVKESDGRWYADIPGWPKAYHKNTEMVFGANRFLEHIAKGKHKVTLSIRTKHTDGAYAILTLDASRLTNGAFYTPHCGGEFTEQIWICPVTLFVLGRYPDKIYVRIL